jgi:hypothetical protein
VNDALFDLESANSDSQVPALADPPILEHQITAIREAFSHAGIDDQGRRQEIVQGCTVRPIASLRELTAAEAHRVVLRVKQIAYSKPRPEGASSWDLREEETWIDKL